MTSADLQQLLDGYRRGEAALGEVEAALDARLRAAPGEAQALLRQLEAARGGALDEAGFARLAALLGAAGDDGDRTRVLPGGTAGRGRGDAPTLDAAAGDAAAEETLLHPQAAPTGEPTGAGAPAGGREEATAKSRAGAAADDDRTRVIPGGTGASPTSGGTTTRAAAPADGADDRTRVLPGGTGGGSPQEAGGPEAATVAGGAGAAPAVSRTAVTEPGGIGADAAWDPTAPSAAPAASRDLGAGDVLKQRFELVEPLGSGGMGAVWKALDKLKEEARDRNPYVAVKLLTGDFRDHPEAFIALQRESAKQQRLAHPNIATVFDFDRDGDTVYMTMEVMTGTPLDQFVASLPEGGLDYEEALPIIEALGAGLAYAHQAGLVHSDLKPGNAFLTEEGSVKLLDFGIARASKTRTTADGDTTLFDPGQLGALTPSYATVEMFDGQDPDPRDDIYALAIIAYQLLTGRHPYDRKPAPRALQMGLVPEPVAKLTRRQNQALRRGLALERDARIESVEAFLDGIRPYRNPLPWIAAAAVVALAIIGTLAWRPVIEYLDEREREAIIAVFTEGGQANVDRAMSMVEALDDPAQREAVAADPRTRQAIIALHVARSRAHFEPAAERYDYAAAESVMDELAALYPDSAEVLSLRTGLARERDETLGQLAERYGQVFAEGRLVADPEAEDVLDLRATVARIDPGHPMLEDARLGARYAEVAGEAMRAGEWERARAVLSTGAEVTGETPELAGLRARVDEELSRQAASRRVTELEAMLGGRAWSSLSDFDEVRAELQELQELRPLHEVLAAARPRLSEVFGNAFAGLLGAGDAVRAQRRLVDYASLLETPAVRGYRERLESAGAPAAQATEVASREQRLRGLLESAAAGEGGPGDAAWTARAGASYRELLALAGAGSEAARGPRESLSGLYLERASALGSQERFEEALALLAGGEALLAGGEGFARQRVGLESAREAKRRREEEARRLARIEELREDLRGHVAEGRVAQAREALEALRGEVDAGDAFVSEEGPRLIAGAYLRRAQAAFEQGAAEAAWVEAREGLRAVPGDAALEAARGRYREAVVTRALALQRLGAPGVADAAASVASSSAPPAHPSGAAVAPDAGAAPPRVLPALATAVEDASRYPALGAVLAGELSARVASRAEEAMRAGEWGRARAVLSTGAEVTGETPQLAGLRARVDEELSRQAASRRVTELEAMLGGRAWSSLSDFDEVRAELQELQELRPLHEVLAAARPRLSEVFGNAFAGLLGAGDAVRAQRRLVDYASLLETPAVRGYRERLESAGAPAAQATEVASREQRLRGLLESAAAGEGGPGDAAWTARAGASYRELLALAGAGSEAARGPRESLSGLYLERASALGSQERFEEALALLAGGEALLAGGEGFARQRVGLESAREAKRRREEEARRLARIEELREGLRGHVAEGRVAQAREALEALRGEVDAGDAFVSEEGPRLIAGAYLRRAQAAFEQGAAEAAWVEAREGLRAVPGDAALEAARGRYREAVVTRALALQRLGAPGVADAAASTAGASREAPWSASSAVPAGEAASPPTGTVRAAGDARVDGPASRDLPMLGEATAKRVAARIAGAASGSPRSVAAMARPLSGFRALYPDAHADLRRAIARTLGSRLDTLAGARDAPAHNALLGAAQRLGLFRDRAGIEGPKPSQLLASLGMQQIEGGELSAALQTAEQVRGEQPDATNLDAFRAEIERRRSEAGAAFERFQRSERARQRRTARQHLEQALALWSDNPDYEAALAKLERNKAVRRGACVASLAGHGKRGRGRCYDTVAGERGPSMVVVPAGADHGAFAIGRNEVTVGDFNRYCKASGACSPLPGAGNLPATGIPLDRARAYAEWLSKHSGAVYRLPTEEEWRYAADAGGQQPGKDFNCRVLQGGTLIKGHSLLNAETGAANGWGLINYVGNAREWVSAGAGVAVRGGAFSDSLVDCGIGLRQPDGGGADAATGFRLVRELG